eukprot:3238146-Rhodomonas_salina.1
MGGVTGRLGQEPRRKEANRHTLSARLVRAEQEGDVVGVIQVMQDHKSAAEVQAQGCAVLERLSEQHEENMLKISAAGGIEAVVGAMGQHAGSEGVQKQGCGALRNLAVNDANSIKIGTAGRIEAVVGAMIEHAGSE